jgi:hypothetical protein
LDLTEPGELETNWVLGELNREENNMPTIQQICSN